MAHEDGQPQPEGNAEWISAGGGSQSERDILVYDDGRIYEHTENDGRAFLRHGPQHRYALISVGEMRSILQFKPDVLREVEAALKRVQAHGQDSKKPEAR